MTNMILRLNLRVFLRIMIILIVPTSLFGQVDTIFNADGNKIEIGESVNGKKQGKWTTYYNNGNIESIGYYDNGKKTGEWIWYHNNGLICSKEKYKYDQFKKGKFWDKNGNPSDISEIKTKAEYPGGIDAFRQMISDNLNYSEDAQTNGIEGRVYVQFIINKEGNLVEAKVLKGVHPSLDKEALRVVNLSEKWKPGTWHGEIVNMSFTFPVVFVLK